MTRRGDDPGPPASTVSRSMGAAGIDDRPPHGIPQSTAMVDRGRSASGRYWQHDSYGGRTGEGA